MRLIMNGIVGGIAAALALAATPVGAAAGANVVFRGAAQSQAELLRPTAVAVDVAGRPLYSGKSAYLFEQAGNPARRVQEWNPKLQLVRVNIGGADPLWLRCADLKPMVIACSTMQIQARRDGTIEIGQPVGRQRSMAGDQGPREAGGVPACPGDPRCPRLKR
jgi:hypothetical protein